jgi:hypothetical protein
MIQSTFLSATSEMVENFTFTFECLEAVSMIPLLILNDYVMVRHRNRRRRQCNWGLIHFNSSNFLNQVRTSTCISFTCFVTEKINFICQVVSLGRRPPHSDSIYLLVRLWVVHFCLLKVFGNQIWIGNLIFQPELSKFIWKQVYTWRKDWICV